jgi:hypothetical protein
MSNSSASALPPAAETNGELHPKAGLVETITKAHENRVPKINALTNQILGKDHSHEFRHDHVDGDKQTWLVSNGVFDDPRTGKSLRLARLLHDSDEPDLVTMSVPILIEHELVDAPLSSIINGVLIGPSGDATELENDEHYSELQYILENILLSSTKHNTDAEIEKQYKKSKRHHKLRRFVAGIALLGATSWNAPKIVTAVSDYRTSTIEQSNQKAKAAAEADTAARAAKLDAVKQFDAAHPIIGDAATLNNGVRGLVPSTELLDGATAPEYSQSDTIYSDISGVKSLPLPAAETCPIYHVTMPDGTKIRIANNGDPRLLVTAIADATADTLTVCVSNPEKAPIPALEKDATPPSVFIQAEQAKVPK